MKLLQKLASSSKYYCNKLLSPKPLLKKPEEEGRPRRDKTDFFGDPEDGVTLKQFVHSISMVMATMVAKSVMVVMLKTAMTYLATCQFTET